MDELLKTVDAIIAHAWETMPQSGVYGIPYRDLYRLTTARKAVIENTGKCLCGGKCK